MIFNIIFIMLAIISLNNKNKKLFLLICFILLIMSCFREKHIGVDSISYYEYGEILEKMSFNQVLINNIWVEKGYSFYSKLIMILGEPYFILLITSLITLIIIYRFCYIYSANYIYSLFLFQGLMYYYDTMNILRQYLAVSICLLAYRSLLTNNKVKFAIMIIIAYFFHKTSIIFLLLYIIKDIKLTKKRIKIIIILVLVIYLSISKLLTIVTTIFPFYRNYLELEHYNDFNLGNRIFFIKDLILGFWLYSLEFFKTREERIQMWIVILATTISFFSIKLGILLRMQLYFSIFYIVIIPNAIYSQKSKLSVVKLKIIGIILIILYHSLFFWLKKEWYLVYPYKSFLFE